MKHTEEESFPYPFNAENVAWMRSVLKGDLSMEALTWDCAFRRPPWVVCGYPITPEQSAQILKDYQSKNDTFPWYRPEWLHRNGQIFSTKNGHKYPNMLEYVSLWQDIATAYPYLDLVFLSLAYNECRLDQELDILADCVENMSKIQVKELMTKVWEFECEWEGASGELILDWDTFDLASIIRNQPKPSELLPLWLMYAIISSLSSEHYHALSVENFLYQPERLRKYMDIGLHIKDGTITVTRDPDEMLRLLAERLPPDGKLPEFEEYTVDDGNATIHVTKDCISCTPKHPNPNGGMELVDS